MELDAMNFLAGFVISGAVAFVIERRNVLTLGGTVGALALGTSVYGLGGPAWLGVVLAFFLSSSALSNLFPSRKEEANREIYEKAGARDFWQVVANGGLSSLLAAAYFIQPQPVFFLAFLGVLAAVNADTWATEIGMLSNAPPRLLTNMRRVDMGRSGGITLLGTIASVGGALFIAIIGVALSLLLQPSLAASIPARKVALIITLGGFLGAMFDSLLGATVQAQFYCHSCRKGTEQRTHRCGTKTIRSSGLDFVDNDVVNMLSSVFGGVAAAVLFLYLP
jgi:uncharacterized protein (TIGR00297 family)